jgi:hypothetical protein
MLEAPDDQAGAKIACPRCQQRLQIPTPPPNKTVLAPLVSYEAAPPAPSSMAPQVLPVDQDESEGVADAATVPFCCRRCGASYDVDSRLIGQTVRCRTCHRDGVAGEAQEDESLPPVALPVDTDSKTAKYGAFPNILLAVVLTLGGGCLFVIVLGFAYSLTGFGLWERNELEVALWGASPEEVRARLGTPARIIAEGPGKAAWTYRNKTRDPRTGKADPILVIVFQGGQVSMVFCDPVNPSFWQ